MNPAEFIPVWDIHGGVHPPENKTQSMQLPLADMQLPEELVFPLNQHIGAPATPIVAVGDHVLGGQKIAEAVGLLSAPIHASTSSEVIAIEDRVLPHVSGMTGLCIVLRADGKHEHLPTEHCENYRDLEPTELLEKIRNAGITGLGGAGFPTAVKLNPRHDTPIDTLIINGTECEPYITADDSLMQNYAEDIIAGAQLLSYILGEPGRVVIGIEDNKPAAIEVISKAAEGTGIQVAMFPTKYPSGGEKQLIQILTGHEVPSGQLPASLGIVVQNVGTTRACWRAVRYGEPLTWRITTIVGEALTTQHNIRALLGTPIQHILNEHGYDASLCPRLIMGGPMMGFSLPDSSVPIVKTTNCIIAPSHEEMPEAPPAQPCIRCGICAEACPATLLPQQLYWYARAEDHERLQNHNLFDCIECGACAFVCPSAIPLVQYYRAAKGEIRKKEQEKIKSDHARKRFEFRKLRMEKAEQEKEAKRLARKQAAEKAKKLAAEKAANAPAETAEKPAAADPVAAAMARVQAKANDPAAQKAKLERAVSASEDRVEKLKARFEESEADKKEQSEAKLKQAEVRLQEARKNLSEFLASNNDSKPDEVSAKQEKAESEKPELKPAPPEVLDAATAAIAKAKAKSEAMAKMSPEEKLKSQLASLETRVQKAREKLAKAEAEGSEHVDALRMGLEKMESKLASTKEELESL